MTVHAPEQAAVGIPDTPVPRAAPLLHRKSMQGFQHVKDLRAWLKNRFGKKRFASIKHCQLRKHLAHHYSSQYGDFYHVKTNGDFLSVRTGEILANVFELDHIDERT